jgi:putative ABC transport system ATP-binding protein
MIITKELTFSYSSGTSMKFPDISVEKTKSALLLGQSGSGKTTFLHLLGGLLEPDTGEIKIRDTDFASLHGVEKDHFRGKHIGFVFQKPHLIQALKVEENLLIAQYLAGERQDKKRCLEVLKHLGIDSKANSKVYELSEGQAQRVSIARAVINKPDLLLADEPTSALDDEHCEKVINILVDLAESYGATLLIATHDQRLKSIIGTHLQIGS